MNSQSRHRGRSKRPVFYELHSITTCRSIKLCNNKVIRAFCEHRLANKPIGYLIGFSGGIGELFSYFSEFWWFSDSLWSHLSPFPLSTFDYFHSNHSVFTFVFHSKTSESWHSMILIWSLIKDGRFSRYHEYRALFIIIILEMYHHEIMTTKESPRDGGKFELIWWIQRCMVLGVIALIHDFSLSTRLAYEEQRVQNT